MKNRVIEDAVDGYRGANSERERKDRGKGKAGIGRICRNAKRRSWSSVGIGASCAKGKRKPAYYLITGIWAATFWIACPLGLGAALVQVPAKSAGRNPEKSCFQ